MDPRSTHPLRFLLVLLTLAGGLLPGCAWLHATGTHPGAPKASKGAQQPGEEAGSGLDGWNPHDVVIVDGTTGNPVPWDQLVDAAADSDVLLLGEIHGHPRVLATMAELFSDIVSRSAGTPALSLEFFERDEQVALADYLTGVTDEEAFKQAAHRTPKNYPGGHRRMVETARSHGLPVIASNAPRRYAKLARTEGFERLAELTEAQRSLFVIPDTLTGGAYRDRFFELMAGMAGHEEGETRDPEETALRYYRAQNLWDATMADSIARGLEQGHSPVVHVVGKFHIEFAGGLVQRLQHRVPGAHIVTVTFVEADAPSLRDDDRGAADYVLYVGGGEETESTE